MSFLHPDPLPTRQKIAALVAVAAMIPVLLDAFRLIDLGAFRMAPFLLLLACAPLSSQPRRPGHAPWRHS
jgi:hypothetical protein